MKIAPSAYKETPKPDKVAALLPLVPVDEPEGAVKKTFNLSTNPGVAGAQTYKVTIHVLEGTESLRTFLNWLDSWTEITIGLNIANNYASQERVALTLLNGTPQTLFSEALQIYQNIAYEADYEAATNTDYAAQPDGSDTTARDACTARGANHAQYKLVDDIGNSLARMIEGLIPKKALQKVKRFLRRECRKPLDMSVRKYSQLLLRINNQEIPKIPPQDPANKLTDDEMLDIILFGTPKSWQKEAERQGFDPFVSGFQATVQFFERIEATEEKPQSKPAAKKDNNSKKNSKDWKSTDKSKRKGYCLIHGDCGHNTDECHKMQQEAKRIKTSHSGDSKPGGYGNKTWKKKAGDSSDKTKKEMNALIKAAVAKGVRKELNSISKAAKRKSDDSSDEEGEVNAFAEQLDMDLKGFNYEDMENLKLDDSSTVSV